MKNIFIVIIAASSLLFTLSAWSASTKEEVKALQVQVETMQKDLAEIKKLLKEGARAPAKRAETPFKPQIVSVGASPYQGKANATITLIEYSDYQCPYCARHYRDSMPTLVEEYIDTGKLKYVMRENPLMSIHPNAMNASMAALCANDQGKYWEMHNIMFDNQRELSVDNLKVYAGDIGLDTAGFNDCLDSKKYRKQVNGDLASGAKLGVRGTPAFALGLTDKDDPDKANMTVLLKGARPLASFKQELEKLLESAK
jgi:protein-disulfide isomerase